MQDLASEFSKKNSGGDTPDPHRGRVDRLPHLPAARPLVGWGHNRPGVGTQTKPWSPLPRCWDPNLGPPQLFSRGYAPGWRGRVPSSFSEEAGAADMQ